MQHQCWEFRKALKGQQCWCTWCTHLFLNDVALVDCVQRQLSLCFGSLSLPLLLLLSELLDPLQLLLDGCCLDGNYISNLDRGSDVEIKMCFEQSWNLFRFNLVWFRLA